MRARSEKPATVSVTLSAFRPNLYDAAVFALVMAAFAGVAFGARTANQPLTTLDAMPISLDPRGLPGYALLTTLRMFAAIFCSLAFTLVAGWAAAKSRKAEMVIVPALDILQSVPILGFLTFTVVFFMGLFPGSELGAELAAVFAIFTSQAWNMAFSFYQSLKTLPADLDEAARHFRLSAWQRFWRLEAPYATPGLVWNNMMSMSGGWFFVVASESISVGATKIALPGIGSYLAVAIERKDLGAVAWAVATMALVILAYDQLLFRPVVAWADKFRVEMVSSRARPRSWVYDLLRRTRLLRHLGLLTSGLSDMLSRASTKWRRAPRAAARARRASSPGDILWTLAIAAAAIFACWLVVTYLAQGLAAVDVVEAIKAGLATLLRVVVLIALASVIWVPVGVWIGLRPALAERLQPLAQFLAAFPANVLFPIFVVAIARHHLDPNIWLSPLMALGTQWYILFNVIAGASVFPGDLLEAAAMSRVKGWLWWRSVMLPGVFPYYVTGALTASGGSWNASIVAEVASWGDTKLEAYGLGSYIANATDAGDYHKVVLGVAVMSVFVLAFNRLVWRRMYHYAERRLRL